MSKNNPSTCGFIAICLISKSVTFSSQGDKKKGDQSKPFPSQLWTVKKNQLSRKLCYLRQFCSSELSPQSLSRSHFQWDGIQRLLVHLNSRGPHVPPRKSVFLSVRNLFQSVTTSIVKGKGAPTP